MQELTLLSLTAALVILLVSTLQFQLKWRMLIWLAGAAFTGVAIWMSFATANPSTFLETAVRHPDALVKALEGNWPSIGSALPPLFDILCIATILVAVGCLIALTPGDAVERFVIPLNIAVLGAIGGALVALGIAGVGFGGTVKRKVYIGVVAADDVYDGDTISMGDVSLRIWGIDAPEKNNLAKNHTRPSLAGPLRGATSPIWSMASFSSAPNRTTLKGASRKRSADHW